MRKYRDDWAATYEIDLACARQLNSPADHARILSRNGAQGTFLRFVGLIDHVTRHGRDHGEVTLTREGFHGGVDALLSQLDDLTAQLQKSDRKAVSDLIAAIKNFQKQVMTSVLQTRG